MNKNKLMIGALIVLIAVLSVGMVMGVSDSKVNTKLKIKADSPIHEGDIIKVKLTDVKNNPIANKTINITITDEDNDSSNYTVVTSTYGNGKLKVDKGAGEYKVKCKFAGDNKYKASKKTKEITVEEEEDNDDGAFYSEQAGRVIYTGEVQEGPDGNWYQHVGYNEWVQV